MPLISEDINSSWFCKEWSWCPCGWGTYYHISIPPQQDHGFIITSIAIMAKHSLVKLSVTVKCLQAEDEKIGYTRNSVNHKSLST